MVRVVPFEPNKIAVASHDEGLPGGAWHRGAASASVREGGRRPDAGRDPCAGALASGGGTFHIEDVQDHVELGLMRGGHHEMARVPMCCTAKSARRSAPASWESRRPGRHTACAGRRQPRRARHGLASEPDRFPPAKAWVRTSARARSGRDAAQPVRRRADGRGLQGLVLAPAR